MVNTTAPTMTIPASGLRRIVRRALRAVRANAGGIQFLTRGPDSDRRSMAVIGDSHAVMLLGGSMPSPRVVRASPTATIFYLGPSLMYSVARDGFPQWVTRLIRARRFSPLARGGLTVVLAVGEIDLRCHLGKPGRGDVASLESLVARYVDRARDLLADIGPGGRIVVLGPNPPSSIYESEEAFPVVGDLAERLAILNRLVGCLTTAVAECQVPALRFLDVRPDVADSIGQLRAELTFDGCHLNAAGTAIVRARLADLDTS